MQPKHRPTPVGFLRLALGAVLTPGDAAQEGAKRLLSEKIRTVLERDGAVAARRWFDEIYPAQKDRYAIDVEGLAELATEYLRAGDDVTARVLYEMTSGQRAPPPRVGPLPEGRGDRILRRDG